MTSCSSKLCLQASIPISEFNSRSLKHGACESNLRNRPSPIVFLLQARAIQDWGHTVVIRRLSRRRVAQRVVCCRRLCADLHRLGRQGRYCITFGNEACFAPENFAARTHRRARHGWPDRVLRRRKGLLANESRRIGARDRSGGRRRRLLCVALNLVWQVKIGKRTPKKLVNSDWYKLTEK